MALPPTGLVASGPAGVRPGKDEQPVSESASRPAEKESVNKDARDFIAGMGWGIHRCQPATGFVPKAV
jgi:hypothetical protein